MTTHAQLDLADPQFRNDPYPVYAALRQDAPIYRTIYGNQPLWSTLR